MSEDTENKSPAVKLSKHGKRIGRPKKEPIRPEHWAERIVKMYEQGCSDDEICADLRISRKEFSHRINNDPAFKKLTEYGAVARRAWWMKIGRMGAVNGAKPQAFNFWNATMKAEFGWGVESTGDGKPLGEKSTDDIRKRVEALRDRLSMAAEHSDLVN